MATRVTSLQKLSVHTSREAEDAVTELLGTIFGIPASVYADAETGETVASVFVPKVTPRHRESVRVGLHKIKEFGIESGPMAVKVRTIPREDWAESWKRHFKPIEVSPRLLIKPSWSKLKPRKGQALVVLDPGLSFGTGQHATTSFCLAQLARLRDPDAKQSLLDAGCGSGILAIAATKLGYDPVHAFDFDPEAVRVALQNCRANGVTPLLTRHDLTRMPVKSARKFDVICANLTYDLLIQERDKLLARLAEFGTIVLAGILREQFGAVEKAYTEAGMKIVAEATEGEWRSAAFSR